jgi:hypothetical protein
MQTVAKLAQAAAQQHCRPPVQALDATSLLAVQVGHFMHVRQQLVRVPAAQDRNSSSSSSSRDSVSASLSQNVRQQLVVYQLQGCDKQQQQQQR